MSKRLTALVMCLALSIAFVFSGCAISFQKEIATVNGDKITEDEFNYFLIGMASEMESAATAEEATNFWDTEIDGVKATEVAKEKALEQSVMFHIYKTKAEELGIKLSKEDKEQLETQKEQTIEQLGGEDMYKLQLQAAGFTDEVYSNLMEMSLYSQKLYQKFIEDMGDVSDEEIQAYYQDNYVKAKHILIKTVDDNRQPLSQEEQDAAKVKADEVYARLQAGEDFDTLMNEFSEDPGLQQEPDGYVFTKNQMDPAFEEAAYALQVGQMSGIVKGSYGYHILLRVDHMGNFEENKDSVLTGLQNEKFTEELDKYKSEATIKKNEKAWSKIDVKAELEAYEKTMNEVQGKIMEEYQKQQQEAQPSAAPTDAGTGTDTSTSPSASPAE